MHLCTLIVRNSSLQMFFKIGVLKNVAIFEGKHLCWNFLLIRPQAWRPANLLKRDSNTGVFLWILRSSLEQLFYRTPLLVASLIVISKPHKTCYSWNLGFIMALKNLTITTNKFRNSSYWLTYFWPIFSFFTPWKHQKIFVFLVFSRGIKWEH